ncbi:MAG: TetR/AcrR family transcriptional regulator [Clostridiales bacterium]|nr:TetR/AcrR family transcriptional regulator [Clostridiales bacterium]
MNRTNGKIAEQSKQKFVEALVTVMKQYDYKCITVTQIAQEADLSRKTFYRLFTDKDEILMLLFEDAYTKCVSQI